MHTDTMAGSRKKRGHRGFQLPKPKRMTLKDLQAAEEQIFPSYPASSNETEVNQDTSLASIQSNP